MLEVNQLSVKLEERTILENINLKVQEKEWHMIVGPNGAGKSTLVRAISNGISYEGTILFEGVDISRYKPARLARKLGVLMQNHFVGYGFTVEEVVALGRYAYAPTIFSKVSQENETRMRKAMEVTGVLSIKDQSVLTLSGGELQRTFLAQLLAQNPRLLILDEPTNHLDLVYQKQVLELVKQWIQCTGQGVISVVHDLSLAKAYGTHGLLLKEGKCLAAGTIEQVFTKENLERAYSMDVYEWMQDMLSLWCDS